MTRVSQLTSAQKRISDELLVKQAKKRFRKKDAHLLLKKLKTSIVEKDIENAWRDAFSSYYIDNPKNSNMNMSSPYNCDGYISSIESSLYDNINNNIHNVNASFGLLMEFKQKSSYEKQGGLTKLTNRVRIIIQLIHYMYKIQKEGQKLPTVLVGADEEQAFVLLAYRFYKYLDGNYNWKCAPSSAYLKDPDLFIDLCNDTNTNVFPFQFNNNGSRFEQNYRSLIDMFINIDTIGSNSEKYHIPVTPSNIIDLYDRFSQIAYRKNQKISSVESVTLFVQIITTKDPGEYYFMPNNHNKFHLPGDKKINVYGNRLEAFLNMYDRNLSPSQVDEITGIADRLIVAEQRRYKGDFWTPDIWGKRANQFMKRNIDVNYKDNSLIWDPAAGVRNLTRKFQYSDLYISTYHSSEIDLGKGYNPERKAVFQYDFLNDDVNINPTDNPYSKQWKMPENLFNDLINASHTNKRVIFYTNPPYGTANNAGAKGTSKKGIANNKINQIMKQKHFGKASQQLYAQFFVRVLKIIHDFHLKNVYIAFFTNARFFAGGNYWQKFNNKLFSKLKFINGILLNAGEFSDTANSWPITFSIYKLRDNILNESENKIFNNSFHVEKSDINYNGMPYIQSIGTHHIQPVYNNNSLSTWMESPIKSIDKKANYVNYNYPKLSSALNESNKSSPSGHLLTHSLGYIMNKGNNIAEGTINNGVWLATSVPYNGHGINVMKQNFDRVLVNFAARKTVNPNWINAQDNFNKPDMNNPIYNDFVNDSLIFSIFSNSSNQAAYRNNKWSNTNINGKWANEWFWLSNEYVQNYANSFNNKIIYSDSRNDNERFVYKEIEKRSFSTEAINVLNSATQVWKDTFEFRKFINEDNPEYYLNAWDAGWYQIKQIPQTKKMNSYKEFKRNFNILINKLSNNIYELNMLTK